MLDILLRYGTKASVGGPDLTGLVQAHYDAVFPESAGKLIDEATAARQFRAQVLVEPMVLGSLQSQEQRMMMPSDPYVGQADPTRVDMYDVRQPPAYEDMVLGLAVAAMSNATSAASLLGVSLPSIPRLGPSSRQGAVHPEPTRDPTLATDVAQANAALSTMLGALGPGDGYLALPGLQCPIPAGSGGDEPTSLANVFAQNIALVKTFITHARYDAAIYTPAIPAAFQAGGWAVTVDTTPRAGVARPGWFTVGLGNGSTVEVRFPSYDTSGHQVSLTQPTELADDVEAWFAAMCM